MTMPTRTLNKFLATVREDERLEYEDLKARGLIK